MLRSTLTFIFFAGTVFAADPSNAVASKESTVPEQKAHKFTNALAKETSPYLLQHAHNPVNWYPWGDEAFEKARKEDKPIFLSVGYSSCHWCHVMEHESFENEAVAKVLNDKFISIKVDREERPDVDEIYMAAVQLVTQSGGWPMTVFMTADGKPFFGGTYFPSEDRFGRMGFKSLLERVDEVWRKNRQDVEKDAGHLSDSVRQYLAERKVPAKGELNRELVENIVEALHDNFDSTLGGFGSRPKFPPNNGLPLLIHLYKTTDGKTRDLIRTMSTLTMDKMALGGIHDHLGGGFHRYSTDQKWLVPHFEKMLYDNALLSASYAEASVVFSNPEYARIARDTYDWVLREMTSPEGGFYSTLDADSEGVEGKFYVWDKKEIDELLGADAETFCKIFNADTHGNFEEEASGHPVTKNILNMTEPLSVHAKSLKMDESELRQKVDAWKAKLLAVRIKRVWPGLDDKILTAWNGLMISSLARGSVLLNEPRYKDAAIKAAEFMLKNQRVDGRWLATHRKGQSKLPAYLDDHAFMAIAFLDLFDATQDKRWLDAAVETIQVLDKHFADPAGGYFFTADDHEKLLARTKDPVDKAIPSGNGWAAMALIRIGNLTHDKSYHEKAAKMFAEFHGLMERAPQASESLLLGLAQYLETRGDKAPPKEELGGDEPAAAKVKKGAVTMEFFAGKSALPRGEKVPLAIQFTMSKKFHVQAYSKNPDDEGVRVALNGKSLGELKDFKYPQPQLLHSPELGGDLKFYEGSAMIGATLEVAKDAPLGKQALAVKVHFQACDDKSCQLPEDVVLTLPMEVVDAKAAVQSTNDKIFEDLKSQK